LEIKIRGYEEKDEDSIRKICCDTGLWGKPIDSVFEDREMFADLIIGPYLKYEPEHVLVAEDYGEVVGYLTGYLNKNFEVKTAPFFIKSIAKMLSRYLKYNKRSRKFVRHSLTKTPFELPKHLKAAHLHINLKENSRGSKIGAQLLDAYERMLKLKGLNHYYGEVVSSNCKRTQELYEKLGFRFYDKVKSTIFNPEINEDLYIMCIHKELK